MSYTGLEILACPMGDNDADAATVGEYLVELARVVWVEEEGMNGKRPFGNSGWKTDVYKALVAEGFVHGEIDEDGWPEDYDEEGADELVELALKALVFS